jgi:hypothetical protein
MQKTGSGNSNLLDFEANINKIDIQADCPKEFG